MKEFMGEDFLLTNETAKRLFFDYSKDLPIIDYHCHLVPREIAEDITFSNITQVWLGADHYKWRQMRSNGIDESLITGNASDKEKFVAWAATLEKAIGNPLYHWSHLELQRYFGFNKPLSRATADEAWEVCNDRLKSMSARQLILDSSVEMLATTDDPIDSLEYHKAIKETGFSTKVAPAWRPDKAMYIEKPDFCEYIGKLEAAADMDIKNLQSLKDALLKRMDYFESMGCSISDHGLAYVMCRPCTDDEANKIFEKKLSDLSLTEDEIAAYKTNLLVFLAREYYRKNWVMQLHFGVKRDNDTRRAKLLGPDTGFDSIAKSASMDELADFLDLLARDDKLPKTILYSLNPIDNAAIGTIIGCFQDSSCVGKIQHGSAWWFNDNKRGMEEQMISLANLGLLGNFVGMLTDSRSFLSYTRHEYFRRIACNLVGRWVENGEYPNDEAALKQIIEGISYQNAKTYFEV